MRLARGLIGPLVACLAAWLMARALLDVVAVRGDSMQPTLRPGDRLLVARRVGPVRPGMVVLAADPRDPRRELVKRVVAVDADGVRLAGDNAARSTDARTFGILPPSAVGWRVLVRYWPPARIGTIGPVPGPAKG